MNNLDELEAELKAIKSGSLEPIPQAKAEELEAELEASHE